MQIWRIARFTLLAVLASFVMACGEEVAEPPARLCISLALGHCAE